MRAKLRAFVCFVFGHRALTQVAARIEPRRTTIYCCTRCSALVEQEP